MPLYPPATVTDGGGLPLSFLRTQAYPYDNVLFVPKMCRTMRIPAPARSKCGGWKPSRRKLVCLLIAAHSRHRCEHVARLLFPCRFDGITNRRVARFDHFCSWMNNAIGAPSAPAPPRESCAALSACSIATLSIIRARQRAYTTRCALKLQTKPARFVLSSFHTTPQGRTTTVTSSRSCSSTSSCSCTPPRFSSHSSLGRW